MSEGTKVVEGVKKRAPTLYAIIAFKIAKGLLLLLIGLGVYRLSDSNLPEQFRSLIQTLHLDPERHFFVALSTKLSTLTPGNVIWMARGAVLYSLFSLVEGVGLSFRITWAGWLAISESAFFVPIEVADLLRSFSWTVFGILVVNIIIVWYLFANRHRLFRHHHH